MNEIKMCLMCNQRPCVDLNTCAECSALYLGMPYPRHVQSSSYYTVTINPSWKLWAYFSVLVAIFFYCLGAYAEPNVAAFEKIMTEKGQMVCDLLGTGTFDEQLDAQRYDGSATFYHIADYTHEAKWLECARRANDFYKLKYVIPNKGNVPGYWNFSRGLAEAYLRTGDASSKDAAILLSKTAAFARDSTSDAEAKDYANHREIAFALNSYLDAERLGEPKRSRSALLVGALIRDIDTAFTSKTAPWVKPFMMALVAEALIAYHEKYPDERIPKAVKILADGLYPLYWFNNNSFSYCRAFTGSCDGSDTGSPDLNNLIAPAFYWVALSFKDPKYVEIGDKIFNGAFTGWYENGKHLNQYLRWSIKGLKWRREALAAVPTPAPTATPRPTPTVKPTATPRPTATPKPSPTPTLSPCGKAIQNAFNVCN